MNSGGKTYLTVHSDILKMIKQLEQNKGPE